MAILLININHLMLIGLTLKRGKKEDEDVIFCSSDNMAVYTY